MLPGLGAGPCRSQSTLSCAVKASTGPPELPIFLELGVVLHPPDWANMGEDGAFLSPPPRAKAGGEGSHPLDGRLPCLFQSASCMRARGSALDGGYLPQHRAPVPVPYTGRPSPSGCQVGKPAERPVCTPVSVPPRDPRGGQDSSEATWLSGRPEGQHGPGDEEGSFRPSVPSFLVSGLWEQAPRVFPGDARWGGRWVRAGDWGCWGIMENHLSSPPREQAPGRTWPRGG